MRNSIENSKFTGNYVRAFLSDDSSSEESLERSFFEKLIERQEDEAVYIYSFKENKLQYASGCNTIFGIDDSEVNIILLNELYKKEFAEFTNEYHDRILLYAYNNNKNLYTFSSKVIVKVKNFETPLLLHIKILKTDQNGNLVSIIGRIKKSKTIQITEIVQYGFEGDLDPDFLFKINHKLDFKNCVSHKMIEILEGIKKNKSIKQIAKSVGYKESTVENLIASFKKNFELKSEKEILDFAEKNYLLPSQLS